MQPNAINSALATKVGARSSVRNRIAIPSPIACPQPVRDWHAMRQLWPAFATRKRAAVIRRT
jgi:hypothetical protein